jgi:hypothetical protein
MLDYLPFTIKINEKNVPVPINENYYAKKNGFSFYARLSPLHNFFFLNVPNNENYHARKKNFLFYARLSPLHNRTK